MSEPFLGEIRPFVGGFVPDGWLPCAGQLMPCQQFSALYGLIGTTYGGNGSTTFALPDLRGRIPLSQGTTNPLGDVGGAETVALSSAQLPLHSHAVLAASTGATTSSPAGAYSAAWSDAQYDRTRCDHGGHGRR